jgi:hypothetical protein
LDGFEGPKIHVHALRPVENAEASRSYGVLIAVSDRSAPLAGSHLYRGAEQPAESSVEPGDVESAFLRTYPKECGSCARWLLARLRRG